MAVTDDGPSDNTGYLQQRMVIAEGSEAFAAGIAQYSVELECIDNMGEVASSSVQVFINALPMGVSCSACRLTQAGCASTNSTVGEPIFDSFRISCYQFSDEHLPLAYQFGYTIAGLDTEVIFDWSVSPSKDVILPAGVITLKSRIRDRLGAATRVDKRA